MSCKSSLLPHDKLSFSCLSQINLCLLFSALLWFISPSHATNESKTETQIWKDQQNGVTVYSDQPSTNSKAIQLKANTTYTPTPQTQPLVTPPAKQQSTKQLNNWQLTLLHPTSEQAIRANDGQVYFRFSLKEGDGAALQADHRVQWILDGEPAITIKNKTLTGSGTYVEFSIPNLDRGQHQIQLQLLDKSGKIIAKTPLTVFYVLRHHINAPN